MLKRKQYTVLLLLVLFNLCPLCTKAEQTSKSILIISSYNPAAHQTAVTISDFIDEYTRNGGKCGIEIENMNCKSFSESPHWKGLMKDILLKYEGDRRPEMIILLGQEAWASYLSQEESTMSGVPMMCSLVSRNAVSLPEDSVKLKTWMPESIDFFSDKLGNHSIYSGFVYEYDIVNNIRMIQHLYPNTRHVAFISDNTYGGVAMQALVRKELTKFPELNLILLDGRSNSIYTIVDKLRQLPPHTVVLVGTWRVDMNEGYFMRNATYSMMGANPTIPVFSLASVGLGHWAIGGVIPAYKDLGRDMAKEALRMLEESPRSSGHIEMIGSQAVIDYDKMKELNVDIDALPFNVKIINKPISFYEQYKYHIWLGVSVLVLLTVGLMVSLFFFFRTKRLKDELQCSERDLREAKERAEESNRLKSSFLANMSHEIRTPLNAIVGFSDVLTSGVSSPEEERAYNDIIKANSDLLLRLISDILDLSRLEANKMELSCMPCDVVLLCKQVLVSVNFAGKSNNQFLFVSEYETLTLTTDPQRLQQVIINLLSNAAKFTVDGTITLELKKDASDKRILISVTDTGCGIPMEKQKQVFERFEKLDEYAQGTGLGLSICSLTICKLGGEIWIDSSYTQGARFIFSHPI